MTHEIELVSDGDGLAVLGDRTTVEGFLASIGSPPSRDLDLPRLSKLMGSGSAGLQAHAAKVAVTPMPDAARWVRLAPESAKAVKEAGGLMPIGDTGTSYAMIGKPGQVKQWVKLDKGPGQLPTNPTLMAGAPALMAQLAMQQAMQEIIDYLAVIDAKLDDVLKSQKNAVLASVIGVGLQIDEAIALREHVGRVNEVTWSKVQNGSGVIAETQAYALLQLRDLADKLEKKSTIADLEKTAEKAEHETREWLAVLARCFQLSDALAVLELDRVLEIAPDDIVGHRLGLRAARQDRLSAIERTTTMLVERIQAAAGHANSRVLVNPRQSPAVVRSSSAVTASVRELHRTLGVDATHLEVESRTWSTAAADVGRSARTQGSRAIGASRRWGSGAKSSATATSQRAAARLEALRQRRAASEQDADE